MGQGQSRSYVSDERGVRVFCKMDDSMVSSVIVPDCISHRFRLEFAKYISLTHPDTGVYCCEIEKIDGKLRVSSGWDEFIVSAGVCIGDSMLFDIRSTDDTTVWVYPGASKQAARDGDGSTVGTSANAAPIVGANESGLQLGQHTDIYATQQSNMILHEINSRGARTTTGEETSEGVVGGCEEDMATPMNPGNDMNSILAVWRPKFIVGRDVELEERMIEFVAAGMEWELPEYGIYVGKVEETSIASNRMRLPRLYTSENVMPLLHGKKKTFYMESEREGDKRLKFSIGKDGRAALTEGWAAFATANGIRGGSILAFSFSDKQTELDVAIDVLRE